MVRQLKPKSVRTPDSGGGLESNEPKRLLIESIVIVVSILLAFAVDAAWDGRV